MSISVHSWAGSALATTTISTTLSMTSPTALISGTGPGATISMTNGYFKNISATTISATNGIGFTKCVDSGDLTITNNSTVSFAHGLGVTPTITFESMRNVTSEQGYAVGSIVDPGGTNGGAAGSAFGYNVVSNSTSSTVVYSLGSGGVILVTPRAGGTPVAITNNRWVFLVRACI